ncbi:non-ribosomal peptide synthetase [Nocardia sp. XZ_19_385]|uniref:non-ribosomal peptide synthetase n=1 Tax=Nocardia sp. XZ_19_385 TaxID=2769488 RepID=UPI0018901B8D|nr:non-ribosomal peptide synthetase [Nocardia sp. XZ_19_385]
MAADILAVRRARAARVGPSRLRTLPQLLETAAGLDPEACAVRFAGRELTYRELGAQSARLARVLIERGVGPGDRVVLALPRSIESVVAMWAVAQTGAAFVPVDPQYPAERVAHMIGDCGATSGLTVSTVRTDAGADLDWLEIDSAECAAALARASAEPVHFGERVRRLYGEDVAYVIYTSGSTGLPKGVAVTHAGLSGLCAEQARRFGVTAAARTLHFASPSFDASILELLLAIGAGATMVVVPPDIYGGAELTELLRDERVTHAFITPAALAGLEETNLPELRTVVAGGEACPAELVARWAPGRSFFNLYGPTETTVAATISGELHPDDIVTIGRPVAGMAAAVLDARLSPVPDRVAGELYLAGPGLARGYHDRAGLTAARFIAHPDGSGERLYRTGDLVRWITGSDGTPQLQFLGRTDSQVKIRGFRVELGEIDAVLAEANSVAFAATVVRRMPSGADALVSYVVPAPGSEFDAEPLMARARRLLPRHAVPTAVVAIDTIPLTPVGKLDYAALPAPVPAARPYREPVTATERTVTEIFTDLLGATRVSADDDFFELGGNSLLATRVAGRLRTALQIQVAARTVFDHPTVTELAAAVDELTTTTSRQLPLTARARGEHVPLSLAQQRMWFLARLDPASAAHNIPIALRLSGSLRVDALTAAMRDVLERHEALRTIYPEHDGSGYQHILPAEQVRVDLAPADIADTALHREVSEFMSAGFDVTAEVPLRARLFRLDADEFVLALVIHHLAADGSSLAPLTRDLMLAYQARTQNQAPEWTPLPVQYADFAIWQRETLGAATDPESLLAEQLRYWGQTLSGLPAALELPADRPRPPVASNRGAVHSFHLDADLRCALEQFAKDRDATLFMVVHAALAVLLARLSGTTDIAIGTPVAGRGEPELDALVGMFVNTLVLRTHTAGSESFAELVDRVRETDLGAFAHADIPFERLVAELDPPRSQAHHPLFQVVLAFQNFQSEALRLPELTITPIELGAAVSPVDLQLTVVPHQDSAAGLSCSWRYATDLFDPATVDALGRRLIDLLSTAVAQPQLPIGDLPILDQQEQAAQLSSAAGPQRPLPHRLLLDGFAAQAQRSPAAVAVSCADGSVTYGELAARVNRLARKLISMGVGPGATVGLAMPPTLESVVGMYAIVQAGAAYVPIDPGQPAARIADILATADPICVLTAGAKIHTRPVLRIDNLANSTALSTFSDAPLTHADRLRPLREQDLAYVIFTSGSTGRPKGVGVPHGAIVNQAAFFTAEYQLAETDTYLQSVPFTFDASLIGYAAPLSVGAHLVLASAEERTDPEQLAQLIARHRVTTMASVPSLLQVLLDSAPPQSLSSLRAVWVGGEPLPAATIARFSAACPARLHNLYGPTEATVSITGADVTDIGAGAVPIGHPHWNCRAYVLDARLHPVPPGTPGELYLSGAQLTRGYLNETARTAERFVADPYGPTGARMYRTGDLVRRNRTGDLEYLGRTDVQLKLRGQRIEPGEIEAALRADSAVTGAAVTVRGAQLIGYVSIADAAIDTAEVLASLRKRLPVYMIPAHLVVVAEFPLGPTGKLDRAALPDPQPPAREYRAPSTTDEQIVAEVFASVLGIDRVGRDDDFFSLGGNSLSAVRVRAALAERLGIGVPLRLLFTYPQVDQLATALRSSKAETTGSDPLADTVLDESITAPACPPPGAPSAILLTGATGFLGAFLLRELLDRTSATIYCLVRADNETAAHARILAAGARYRIDFSGQEARIVAIPGDLAQPRLGLTAQRFLELAERTDEIYHNGALVNHLEPYDRMRAANVAGTTEVLRLAATARVKPVHYVSTSSAPPTADLPSGLPGYVLTKWVAEQLVRAGAQRGIPATIYRPGLITGDSRTGAAGTDDAWWTMLRSMLVTGMAPDLPDAEIAMLPVDHVAATIVRCARQPHARETALDVSSETALPLRAIVDEVRRRGYRLDLVEPERFPEALTTAAEERVGSGDESLSRAAALSTNYAAAEDTEAPAPAQVPAVPVVNVPGVDAAVLTRYFDFFIETGFFPPPPRK